MAFYDRILRALRLKKDKVNPILLAKSGSTMKSVLSEVSYPRKPLVKLEQIYYSDPLIFNIVNFYVKSILAPGWRIEVDNDFNAKTQAEKFFRKIRLDCLLEQIVNHLCVFGNAWVEIVMNKKRTEIVDLVIIDPKTMDFKRNERMQVVLDNEGEPIGYIQRHPYTGEKIEFAKDEIAHFTLYTLGSSMLGIGIIEPLFKTAIGKMNIEEANIQKAFRVGFPFLTLAVGDERHEPTPQEIKAAAEQIENIYYKTDLVHPYYWKLNFHTSKGGATELRELSEYLLEQIIAGSGIPYALATGSGKNTNRAILDIQLKAFEETLKIIRRKISVVIEKKILAKMAQLYNWKEVPRFEWNEARIEDTSRYIENIIKLIEIGLLRPEDVPTDYLKKLLRLPEARGEHKLAR